MNSGRRKARPWLALGAFACTASLPGCELLFPVDQFMDGGDGSTIRDADGPKAETDDSPMDFAARDGRGATLDAAGSPHEGPESRSSGSSDGDSGGRDEAGHDGQGTSSGSGGGEASDDSSGVEPSPTDGSVPDEAGSVPDDDARTCQQASDCSGTPPQLCVVCPGGGGACPHWECQGGTCVATTVCAAPPDASPVACGTGVCPPGERCCNPCGGTCVSATSGVACPYDSNPAIACAGANP